jgi:hypothetical protein
MLSSPRKEQSKRIVNKNAIAKKAVPTSGQNRTRSGITSVAFLVDRDAIVLRIAMTHPTTMLAIPRSRTVAPALIDVPYMTFRQDAVEIPTIAVVPIRTEARLMPLHEEEIAGIASPPAIDFGDWNVACLH